MMPSLFARIATGLAVATVASKLFADEYHYNNVLIGDRAAGMGGAYTAISDDASGLYYNPAGIMFAKGRNLSASVNAYNRTNTSYERTIGGNDYDRSSTTLLPNFFGLVRPLGSGVVGFSFAVPDSVFEDQDQTFNNIPTVLPGVTATEYVVNYNNRDDTYLIGPSYALELNKQWAIGATLYAHIRKREWIQNELLRLDTGQDDWTNIYYQTDETGVRPVLGVMWSGLDKVSIGLSLTKTYILDSDTTVQTTYKAYNQSNPTRTVVNTDEKRKLPWIATLGAAWFPSESLLVSADVSYAAASEDSFVKREATWNGAVGVEYYLNPRWAWRGGLFTNRAATPRIDAGQINQREHVDLYGIATSISRFAANTSTTVGLAYSQGSGEAQLFRNSTTIVDVDRNSLSVFLSASTAF